MQLEPQLLASQRDVAQTSTDSVLRDSRALSPNKRMPEWRVKKFGDLCFMIHWHGMDSFMIEKKSAENPSEILKIEDISGPL
jgi:hypothetical protein